MAKRTRKSGLKVNPYKAHAQDETEYGTDFINLPGGITGGIAQLVEAKIGTYAGGDYKGEKFIYFGGVVMEPKTAINTLKVFKDGKIQVMSTKEIEVKGQRTGMTMPLCDTTKSDGKGSRILVSTDENIGLALNELRKLGGPECTAEIENEETLVQVLEALKEEGPFFKFTTNYKKPTKEYPTPDSAWENWFGAKGLEDYEPEEEDDVDESAGSEEPEGAKAGGADTSDDDSSPNPAALAETADEVDENDDATESAENAQRELSELASSVGISKRAADAMDTWDELASAITEASDSEPADEEPKGGDEDPNWVPQKEEVYKFKPPRARNAVEVMVTTVNKEAQTVTAKSLENEKVYKAVPWSKLEDV